MAGVHTREKQEVVDYAGQSVGLVKQSRELMIDLGFEIFAGQQTIEARAQNSDRALQLMGGVGGIPSRSFQFFAGGGEGSFGTFSLHVIFLKIQRQLLHRNRETGGDQMADHEATE